MKKFLFTIFFTLLFSGSAFAQESQPLKILERPTPKLTEEQRKSSIEVQGTITLRVEFLDNGQIGKITPVSSLPYGLTENAIEAAKKIKFEPEKKDGVPIATFKAISYSFKYGWIDESPKDEKAEAVIKRAVENLGGDKYLQVKSQIARGKYHIMRDGALISFQTFVDVIVYPNKERTEFKFNGVKNIQTNTGDEGWVFDGAAQAISEQSKEQIENFKRFQLQTSLDHLLRGSWRGRASLVYVGKREAGVGTRNEVVKLVFAEDFEVEFEFAASDGIPIKARYKRTSPDNEEIKEEDRYAQFVDIQGIKAPFIVDHFSNNVQTSRINYESMEFNKSVADWVFLKPSNAKDLKKDLKF